ncbi:LysM peptidoglycan-binding domain-containing protein [Enterococcus timonensis]|uniref:LysM peptidoglycan-binding domain-containing protein n=1 Tax=Enterococcus timonensis TaxID=1852364 RepID=UPI0008DA258E|nr:LysM peptidoglycan-binding domain-containing protein [Enterococcus timonensis]
MNRLDIPRKYSRRQLQQKNKRAQLKKNIALTSSTLALAGVCLPLANVTQVSADSIAPAASFSANNQQAFIEMVASYAAKCANQNDLYASIMIAQSILESGWGTSQLASSPNFNLFGIKGSYQGQTVYMNTQEWINGQYVTKYEPFRKYPSYYESFQDNANVLKTTRFGSGPYFYAGAWKSNTNNYQEATLFLTGRYATDPSYNVKLNNLIVRYNLTQYDTPSTNPGGNTNPGNGGGSSSSQTPIYYTVKSGDGLWRIAQNHGVTIAQLQQWNHLTSEMIHPNQRLIVGYQAISNPETSTPETNVPEQGGNATSQNYTVVRGDSLWAIAQKFGTSINQIKTWNNLSSDMIHPGDVLIVGQSAGSTTPNPSTPAPSTPNPSTPSTPAPSQTTYTVKAGDGLWRIAQNHGVSVAQLKQWNHLSSDMIHPGDVLVVSQSAGSTTPTPTPSATYSVKSGDTLWAIAQKAGISVDQLKSLNQLTTNTIYVNQVLKLS